MKPFLVHYSTFDDVYVLTAVVVAATPDEAQDEFFKEKNLLSERHILFIEQLSLDAPRYVLSGKD